MQFAKLITTIAFILLANTLLAQDTNTTLPNLGQAIGEGAEVAALKARIAELEAELNPTTNEFAYKGDDLIAHLKSDHRALPALIALHERLHQSIERLRPPGENSFIVFEGTDEEFSRWPERSIADKWPIVRRKGPLGWVVAIGKTHWSEAGYLTNAKLQRLVNVSRPGFSKPKKAAWSIKRIVMHTMNRCSRCDDWKRDDLPQAQADGVEIEIIPEGNGLSGQSYPYFEVQYCNDDQCRKLNYGYVRYQTMKQAGSSL